MIIKIGGLQVDSAVPCDVVEALNLVLDKLATGSLREVVWFGDDKVTYTKANPNLLKERVAHYQGLCDAANGQPKRRRRFATRFCY
ncbi:hypothetical protein SAMN04515647_4394 [Cohaesibacter sp. ES.047]|uniref:hypothetical protein n=1 Tax=Cohaesibacter sp. ES.047 TaxID=1798205 RepID=UPI000BB69DBD|nr:hypothetical protein [Cohaesibacter sp. ES.047]SNY94070.1 hypothetical protein SAMN04515647_4394 [Cohaesibacter sp. ES.047]